MFCGASKATRANVAPMAAPSAAPIARNATIPTGIRSGVVDFTRAPRTTTAKAATRTRAGWSWGPWSRRHGRRPHPWRMGLLPLMDLRAKPAMFGRHAEIPGVSGHHGRSYERGCRIRAREAEGAGGARDPDHGRRPPVGERRRIGTAGGPRRRVHRARRQLGVPGRGPDTRRLPRDRPRPALPRAVRGALVRPADGTARQRPARRLGAARPRPRGAG